MLIGLLTVPAYLRCIGPERYGALAVIWALLAYFSFFDAGFGRAVTQRMARISESDGARRSQLLWTALVSTFAFGTVASVALWFVADVLLLNRVAMSDATRAELSDATLWLLPALPVLLPTTVLQGALQARLRFFEVNAVQSLGTAIGQLLPLSVALLGHTQLSALVPAVLVSRLVVVTLLLQQCGRHVPLSWTPTYDRTDVIELARYGGWVSVVTFLAPMLVTIDRLVIATMSGAASVTAYTVPYDLSSRVMVVSGSLSSALFPRLALATPAKSADLATRTTKLLTAVMTPLVLVGMLGVKPFLDMWLGPTLAAPSSGVAEIILVGVWVNALVIPHGTRLLAVGNPRTVAFIYLAQLPVYISLLTLGLKYWGILGAAVAWTTRVLMDTCMLLRVGGELGRTIRMSIPYAILVVSALLIVLLVELTLVTRLAIGAVLLSLSLVKDLPQLKTALVSLRSAPT